MKEGPDGRAPQRSRSPDSIWERYLMGKLSLEDKETLPALIKELHREIAQHIRKERDTEITDEAEVRRAERQVSSTPLPALTPMIDITARRSHVVKHRRIEPGQN